MNGWTKVFYDDQKTPYAYSNTDWVGYETGYSAALKVKSKAKKASNYLLFKDNIFVISF